MTRTDQLALGLSGDPRSGDVTTLDPATHLLQQTRDSLRVSEERLRLAQQAEQELRAQNENLERALRERTMQLTLAQRELEAFTYSVAHDLRAPVRGMSGFAKILLDEHGAALNEDARDCLRRIQGNALVMSELIDGLLVLARVARGALEPVAVDWSEMARAAAAAQAAQQPERSVQVVVREGLRVQLDRALARMLLDNLLGNAWKFTRKASSAQVEVGCVEQRGELVHFVRDNGVGFNMAYANKLFVPFQRLHASREFPGTGVGLAACYRIVSRHGGRMWAEAKEEEGATFFFTLPECPASEVRSVGETHT